MAGILDFEEFSDPNPPPRNEATPRQAEILNLDDVYNPYEDPAFKSSVAEILIGPGTSAAALAGAASGSDAAALFAGGPILVDLDPLPVQEKPRQPDLFLSTEWNAFPDHIADESVSTVIRQNEPVDLSQAIGDTPVPIISNEAVKDARPLIPQDARAFGSEDLFGRSENERTAQVAAQEEATKAYTAVIGFLPDIVQQQLPSCTNPTTGDAETEEVYEHLTAETRQRRAVPPMDPQHKAQAKQRATEGRWVPTYMRHQMASNHHHMGHQSVSNTNGFRAEAQPTFGEACTKMASSVFNMFLTNVAVLPVIFSC